MPSTKLTNYINLVNKEDKYLTDIDKEKLLAEVNEDNLEYMKKKTLHRMTVNADKKCLHCGERIVLKNFIAKLDRMKFCKPECNMQHYNNSRRKASTLVCSLCGSSFLRVQGSAKSCPECIDKLKAEDELEKSNKAKVLKQHDTILTREMKHENILAQFKIRQGNIYSLAEKNFFEACTMQIQLDADIAKYNFERMTAQ